MVNRSLTDYNVTIDQGLIIYLLTAYSVLFDLVRLSSGTPEQVRSAFALDLDLDPCWFQG